MSRGESYAAAFRALLASDAKVTKQLDRVHGDGDTDGVDDEFVASAARSTFMTSAW